MLVLSSARLRGDLGAALGEVGYEVHIAPDVSAIAEHVEPHEPAIVVLDHADHDWLRLVSDQLAARPASRPVLLAELDGAEEFLAAVNAGVAGFCAPDAGIHAIVRTIESVRSSGIAIPRSMVVPLVDEVRHGRGHRVLTAAGPIDVTDREWDILQLLLQRRSTREMAGALFVSVGTVRSHVSALLRKLGAVDREDAIALVERGRHS